jgi:hypothetical protein
MYKGVLGYLKSEILIIYPRDKGGVIPKVMTGEE